MAGEPIRSLKNSQGLEVSLAPSDFELEGVTVIGGGDTSNPTWEEYLNGYIEDFKPHIELIRDLIKEINWVGRTGGQICNYYHFNFSDGNKIGFTWRAWGDLMQAIVGKREGYMKYYM